MKVRFTQRALRHLSNVRAYIALDNPAAAGDVSRRLRDAMFALEHFPERGRLGRVAGTRELVVAGLPYIVAYRLSGEHIDILAVIHGKRAWPRRGF